MSSPLYHQHPVRLDDLLMEPPSYEEANLHAPAVGTRAFDTLPPPPYDASIPVPTTPPPTYGEAGKMKSYW